MKKARILSLLLALALVFTLAVPAQGAGAQETAGDCGPIQASAAVSGSQVTVTFSLKAGAQETSGRFSFQYDTGLNLTGSQDLLDRAKGFSDVNDAAAENTVSYVWAVYGTNAEDVPLLSLTLTGPVGEYAGTVSMLELARDGVPAELPDDAELRFAITDPCAAFTDINRDAWYHEAIDWVLTEGYMVGISDTQFAPNASLNRAMMVTILYRVAGCPAVESGTPFTDVEATSYYADAVAWAYANGIVLGMTETQFAPKLDITREQFVTILYRYAQFTGCDVSASASLEGYTDGNTVSSFARTAVQWAVAEGLMVGRTGTTLVPKGTTTRAETAALFQRFCEKILN